MRNDIYNVSLYSVVLMLSISAPVNNSQLNTE